MEDTNVIRIIVCDKDDALWLMSGLPVRVFHTRDSSETEHRSYEYRVLRSEKTAKGHVLLNGRTKKMQMISAAIFLPLLRCAKNVNRANSVGC